MVQFWVIDASVIGVANNLDHPRSSDAIELLNRLRRGGSSIILNEEIEREYWGLCQEFARGSGSSWWYKMQGSGNLEYRFRPVSNQVRQELIVRSFHDDDYKYIAAALSVSARNPDDPTVCIVQEDREDFGKIEDLLSNNGIRLATIEEAIQIIETEDEHA